MQKPQSKGAALVASAGARLVLDHPFFAAMYLRLELLEVGWGTFFTDGRRIGYNPAFVEIVGDVDHVLFILAHEVMHNALCHPYRRGERDPKLWNDACDYAINAALVDMGMKMPTAEFAEGLLNPKFGSSSAEEIYEVLLAEQQAQPKPQPQQGGSEGKAGKPSPGGKQAQGKGKGQGSADKAGEQNQQQQAGGSGNDEAEQQDEQSEGDGGAGQQQGQPEGVPQRGKGSFDVVLDATAEDGQPLSQPEKEEQQREWEIAVQAAAMQQMAQGTMPGMLKELIKPRPVHADWRALLAKWMQERCTADYRWDRPNSRYASTGMYLPAQRDDAMGEMVVAIDTSGSISSAVLERFMAEIEAQRAAVQPRALHVLVADAAVQGHWEFQPGEPVDGVEMRGRGGTDFRPVFRWVEEAGLQPACLIYLTDLAGTFPDDQPGYPVLWVNYADYGPHYRQQAEKIGEVVDIAPER